MRSFFTYLLLTYKYSDYNFPHIFFICFLFSNLIPIITVLILKKYNIISDLDATIKEQRILPLMLGVLYSFIGFLFLYFLNADLIIQGLMFCYMTNTIITIIITKYWKISIHSMGASIPLAALLVSNIYYPLFMIIILTIVGISRVIIKAHTIRQVLAGMIMGFSLTYLQLFLFLNT